MRIFVYEFVTGGGWYSANIGEFPPDSLLREGRAMLLALAGDFLRTSGVDVSVLHDGRLGDFDLPHCRQTPVHSAAEERTEFKRLAAEADWTVVIAPEFDGFLLDRCARVIAAGGRLLGPGLELVRLAGDKHITAEHLAAHGIAVPAGRRLAPGETLPADFTYPAVAKPCDGAGSQGVRLIAGPDAERPAAIGPLRLEAYCQGTAASVAVLCGPDEVFALPACRQRLSDDGSFAYLGGELPLAPALDERARTLAGPAGRTLPGPLGYIGVDLVLGRDPSGAQDVVIEVNPRLTTSYVGLRAAADVNLAEAMLQIAQGRPATLSFRPRRVEFDACGTVRIGSHGVHA